MGIINLLLSNLNQGYPVILNFLLVNWTWVLGIIVLVIILTMKKHLLKHLLDDFKNWWANENTSKVERISIIGVLIIIYISIIAFIPNISKEWIGYWGNIAGGFLAGFVTLLSVRLALSHAEKIHNTSEENENQRRVDDRLHLEELDKQQKITRIKSYKEFVDMPLYLLLDIMELKLNAAGSWYNFPPWKRGILANISKGKEDLINSADYDLFLYKIMEKVEGIQGKYEKRIDAIGESSPELVGQYEETGRFLMDSLYTLLEVIQVQYHARSLTFRQLKTNIQDILSSIASRHEMFIEKFRNDLEELDYEFEEDAI
jgi:hypothetical protein